MGRQELQSAPERVTLGCVDCDIDGITVWPKLCYRIAPECLSSACDALSQTFDVF